MSEWWEKPSFGTPPAPVVHDKGPNTKPVLYDAKGKPLAYAVRRVGFQPPQKPAA